MRKGTGVNTNRIRSTTSAALRLLARRRPVRIAVAIAAIAVVAVIAYAMLNGSSGDNNGIALAEVRRGPLTISVIESGTVTNQEQVVLKNEVEGMTTILSLIPEGTHVEKGALLVELDASQLVDARTQQQIVLQNAEASFIQARENLEVMKSQTESDIAKAELQRKFAQQDLDKYVNGDYPRERQQVKADITIAQEELRRAEDNLAGSERLAASGYITRTELEADRLAKNRAAINLELADGELTLLETYTHQRNLDQRQSDLEQATEALKRTKLKAAADLIQAEAELKARQSEYQRQTDKLDKLNQQIAKCRIVAPVSGMVVYATTGKGNWRGNTEPLQEGSQVREREELIDLPTTSEMTAEVKVHEASLRKVSQGMPVRLTVDAMPGKVFWGRVTKIGLLPDAQSRWMNPDLKVYNTDIQIDGDASDLRPGMTCRAEIIVEQYEDALFVPLQAIARVGGKTVAYVWTGGGSERREVQVGLDNNRMVRIVSGLAEGEQVLLAPPLAPSATEDGQGPEVPDGLRAASMPAVAAVQPGAGPTSQPAGQMPFDPTKLRDMTPEQRRQFLANLTPEQRDQMAQLRKAMEQQMGGQAPAGDGQGRRRGARQDDGAGQTRGTRQDTGAQ